jgi:hypothetical protein
MAVLAWRLAGVTVARRWRAVPGVTHGRQLRRAPQGAKAELPARSWRESRGRLAPAPPSAAVCHVARHGAVSRAGSRAVRRAARSARP